MKKILPLLLFTLLSSNAQVIDAIAIDVNGEPITIVEIQAVQQKLKMSKKAAVEALIKDRLEKGAIEKAHINISDQELDQRTKQISARRGMNLDQMKTALQENGLTWDAYKEQLSMELKKEHFFQQYIASSISQPTDEDLKVYYETHKDKFDSKASDIQMSLIVYASQNSQKLQESIQNPLKKIEGVEQKSVLASSSEMAPQLVKLIENTPEGSFTQPINTGRGFVAYYVKSKGQGQGGFASVKNAVTTKWMQEQRIKAGNDFFNKLKSNANIRIIRL